MQPPRLLESEFELCNVAETVAQKDREWVAQSQGGQDMLAPIRGLSVVSEPTQGPALSWDAGFALCKQGEDQRPTHGPRSHRQTHHEAHFPPKQCCLHESARAQPLIAEARLVTPQHFRLGTVQKGDSAKS